MHHPESTKICSRYFFFIVIAEPVVGWSVSGMYTIIGDLTNHPLKLGRSDISLGQGTN